MIPKRLAYLQLAQTPKKPICKLVIIHSSKYNQSYKIKPAAYTSCSSNANMTRSDGFGGKRPTTTDLVARRLIAGALGMKPVKKSAEQLQHDDRKFEMARGIQN
jgi:hypothetical protein